MWHWIQELIHYKFLVHELVIRDIKKKYRRSVPGIVWSVLNPLLTMAVTAMAFLGVSHGISLIKKMCNSCGLARMRANCYYRSSKRSLQSL